MRRFCFIHFNYFCLFFSIATNSSHACTVCMGAKTGPLAEATNAAIFLLLGVLATVLGLISFAGYTLMKRSQAPIPSHHELVKSVTESNLS